VLTWAAANFIAVIFVLYFLHKNRCVCSWFHCSQSNLSTSFKLGYIPTKIRGILHVHLATFMLKSRRLPGKKGKRGRVREAEEIVDQMKISWCHTDAICFPDNLIKTPNTPQCCIVLPIHFVSVLFNICKYLNKKHHIQYCSRKLSLKMTANFIRFYISLRDHSLSSVRWLLLPRWCSITCLLLTAHHISDNVSIYYNILCDFNSASHVLSIPANRVS